MRDLHVRRWPFPHLVVDGWWDESALRKVLDEFPDPDVPGWRRYGNDQELKYEGPPGLWGPATRNFFDTVAARADVLGNAFGIDGLTMETIGGGYHLIPPGGYLKVHTDFSVSPRTGMYRRLNCITYLNDDWDDPGGHLELWDGANRIADVPPEFNRTVIFETSDHSWHGHPVPTGRWRKSVAAYFFTAEPPPGFAGDQSTVWMADAHRS